MSTFGPWTRESTGWTRRADDGAFWTIYDAGNGFAHSIGLADVAGDKAVLSQNEPPLSFPLSLKQQQTLIDTLLEKHGHQLAHSCSVTSAGVSSSVRLAWRRSS